MKTCPVCKTSLFDDMEVCYGCMYTFGSKPELEQRVSEQRVQEQCAKAQQNMPANGPMAGWSVRLEMKNAADPARSWSIELAPSQPATQPTIVNAACASIA